MIQNTARKTPEITNIKLRIISESDRDTFVMDGRRQNICFILEKKKHWGTTTGLTKATNLRIGYKYLCNGWKYQDE